MTELVRVQAKGLLFDMDGVLISSIGSVVRSWQKWAGHYKIPDAENLVTPHGMRAKDIIEVFAPTANAMEALNLIEQIELDDMDDLKVLPGVQSLLQSLPPERWTIVTSATRRLLLGRLQQAGLPVPASIVSAEDVTNGKPDPEPYRRGAELIYVAPEECIVLEDAPSGVRAGREAGARVLGVLGTSSEEALRAAGATWLVPSLDVVKAKHDANGVQLEFPALV